MFLGLDLSYKKITSLQVGSHLLSNEYDIAGKFLHKSIKIKNHWSLQIVALICYFIFLKINFIV